MAGSMKSNKNNIKALLPGVLKDRGWEKQLDLHSIFPRWREIVGDEMNEYAQPLKIEKGVLWLEVANSSWLQQMQYEKLDLLDTLNRNFRLSKLHDIKMVLPKGKVDKSRSAEQESAAVIQFVRPSEKKIAAFRHQVECIADEKCREALMQFWYLAQACKRKKK